MTTLEKQIAKVLKDNDLYLNSDITSLSDIAEYIDMTNEANDEYYGPEEWLRDTKISFPEYLLNREEVQHRYYDPILSYLATQRELCIDQTGRQPTFDDYKMGMDCEEFECMLTSHELEAEHCSVNLEDLFNYLLDYWNKN